MDLRRISLSNKGGSTDWTVGKLVSIILLIIVLILVIYGFTVGAFNPLKAKIVLFFSEVQGYFGSGGGDKCYSDLIINLNAGSKFLESIGIKSETDTSAMTICESYCKIDLSKQFLLPAYSPGATQSGSFSIENNKYSYWGGSAWYGLDSAFLPILANVNVARNERVAFNLLASTLNPALGYDELRKITSTSSFSIQFKIASTGADVIVINSGLTKWEVYSEGESSPEIILGDEAALNRIYDESDDSFSDDNVYWRISYSGGSQTDYQIIPGMIGDAGEIDDNTDFQNFKTWFYAAREKLIASSKPSQEKLDAFRKNLKFQEATFNGQKVVFDAEMFGNYPIVYFSKDSKQYGVVLDDNSVFAPHDQNSNLVLMKFEDGKWGIAPTSQTYLKTQNYDAERAENLNLIKQFLSSIC